MLEMLKGFLTCLAAGTLFLITLPITLPILLLAFVGFIVRETIQDFIERKS